MDMKQGHLSLLVDMDWKSTKEKKTIFRETIRILKISKIARYKVIIQKSIVFLYTEYRKLKFKKQYHIQCHLKTLNTQE